MVSNAVGVGCVIEKDRRGEMDCRPVARLSVIRLANLCQQQQA